VGKRVETRVNVRLLGAAVRPEIRVGDGTARASMAVDPTSQKRDVGHPAVSLVSRTAVSCRQGFYRRPRAETNGSTLLASNPNSC